MRDRSFRRWQQSRATNRAARYLRWLFANRPEMVTPHRIARFAVDRTPCSCAMCGNPRRTLTHSPAASSNSASANSFLSRAFPLPVPSAAWLLLTSFRPTGFSNDSTSVRSHRDADHLGHRHPGIEHRIPIPQLLNNLLRAVTLPATLRHRFVSWPILGLKTLISTESFPTRQATDMDGFVFAELPGDRGRSLKLDFANAGYLAPSGIDYH